jgi:hypothetical protein
LEDPANAAGTQDGMTNAIAPAIGRSDEAGSRRSRMEFRRATARAYDDASNAST